MSDQKSIDEEIRQWVEKYYKERTSFAMHFMIFFIVNVLAWGLWFFGGINLSLPFPWPFLVTAGWGAGLAAGRSFQPKYRRAGADNPRCAGACTAFWHAAKGKTQT